MQIGNKIRKVRELKGIKQEALADALGMSVTAYGNIERGESSPSYERLEQIAAALNVTVNDIVNMPEQFNIEHIANAQVAQLGYNYGTISSADAAGYQSTIAELQKQNLLLIEEIKKLTSALITKI